MKIISNNKIKSTLIITICVINLQLSAQNKTVDSLKLALKNAKHDTVRVNTLLAMVNEYYLTKPDTAVILCEQALPISQNSKFSKGISESYAWLAYLVQQKDIPKALEYYSKSLKIQEETGDKKGISISLNNIGEIYRNQGDIPKALEYYKKSLKIKEEVGNKKGIAYSLNNIATIYNSQGDIPKALEYYSKSLKIRQELGDKSGIATSLNNIATIYNFQGEIFKALEYYNKSLKIQEEIGDKNGIAFSLNNIGELYRNQGNATTALEYYKKSLKIKEEVGNKKGIANSLNNIGLIYSSENDISKALEYYEKSLKIRQEIKDKNGIASSFINIGNCYLKLAYKEKISEYKQISYNKAREYCAEGMKKSMELGFPENIRNAAKLLSQIYKATGNHKLALENYELFIHMRDSLDNISTQKATIKQQAKYDYEQKKVVEDIKHKLQLQQQEDKAVAEKNKQNIIIGSVSLVLLLVAVFLGFLYNRFKVTQKQKSIIELKEKETQFQKHIIEEKHKEITDSINYAERIQRSFLATKQMLDENLNQAFQEGATKQTVHPDENAMLPIVARNNRENFFVLFKPKDVVSGDFYWAATLNNGNFALATADSTGHGVPGAIMSLLNITSLEKAIETSSSPNEILNSTRKTIIERLKKDGSEQGGKDGMDCSLISFDFKNKKLFIANANNPVWIVRALRPREESVGRVGDEKEVIEIKADKMPVGKHDKDQETFTLKVFDIQHGDVVYTLTDGFPDQFGGDKGKKFMSKSLRELLASNSHLPMYEQKEVLERAFKNWVGNLEQVDDVTVIGIRI